MAFNGQYQRHLILFSGAGALYMGSLDLRRPSAGHAAGPCRV